MADVVSAEARLSAVVRDRWETGAVVDLTLRPLVPLADWQVTVDLGGEVVNIWNAEVVSRQGTVHVLRAADYNAAVPPGAEVIFGVEVQGRGPVELISFAVAEADVSADTAVAAPPVPLPGADAGAPSVPTPTEYAPPPGSTRLENVDVAPIPSLPPLTVDGSTVAETPGTGAGLPGRGFDPGPLTTRGSQIVDTEGEPVPIHGLNWFGLETEIAVPHGLWARNWRTIMDEAKNLGFNALRIPYSGDLAFTGGQVSGIDTALNPDLDGLNGLEILDAIVGYADVIGMRILLDYHRNTPGGGPNEGGLWFGEGWTEADVIEAWRIMARRYADDPAVIGADLVNEPYGGTWGDGTARDWAAAAERIGNAVLALAPDWLVVVEGIAEYEGDPYWWGGNLQGVADRPVRIDRPEQLVYSAHDYPASVFAQPWFSDGTDLVEKFRQNWGYIVEEGIAPVLVGEWGSFLATAEDLVWARALADYMDALDIPWMWWSLNPNSGDTGGLYQDDWRTVRPEVLELLDRFLIDTRPEVTFDEIARTANVATFTIALAEPLAEDVVLKYATTDGTAVAGRDYIAAAGSLTFAAGETRRTVDVPILPDAAREGDEFFYLVLGGSGSLQGSGTAVIVDEERERRPTAAPVPQPFVDVASTVVSDAAGVARFRLVLSEPATRDVRIDFTTEAENGRATSGSVTIPAGERQAILEVSTDGGREPAERFTLELTGAAGAEIRTGNATAVVAQKPVEAGEVSLARSATEETQLVIDLILENDWGSGALFNVVIRNVSDRPVNGWQLAMDLPFDLEELWSAVLLADAGERVTLGNAEWNGAIAPGQEISFGFISDVGGIALGQFLAAADLELAVQ